MPKATKPKPAKERGDLATRYKVPEGREPLSKESITLRLPQSLYTALNEHFASRVELLAWIRKIIKENFDKTA